MKDTLMPQYDYNLPIKISDDVYWVGFYDTEAGLHCNPYLIKDGDEAIVIDGGSRPDFPTVMMKILQTGIVPSQIKALIYQHYDPDLCGSIPNFEDIIDSNNLIIVSDKDNNMFIRHYYVKSKVYSLEKFHHEFQFSSGRKLNFINTPYSHSAGSFVTFDEKTKILFSSDIFGSYGPQWDLFLKLDPECQPCISKSFPCLQKKYCHLSGIVNFHRRIMTSNKALRHALQIISDIPFEIIAPQHGSIINNSKDIVTIIGRLLSLCDIGIDRLAPDCDLELAKIINKKFQRRFI
jgi:flavorubredoxin